MDLIVYEAGVIIDGKYEKYRESLVKDDMQSYLDLLESAVPLNAEIVFLERYYTHVGTSHQLNSKLANENLDTPSTL